MPYDDVSYLRCRLCGAFVVDGEECGHEHGCLGDPDHPISDWKHAVNAGDTWQGYSEWLAERCEEDERGRST